MKQESEIRNLVIADYLKITLDRAGRGFPLEVDFLEYSELVKNLVNHMRSVYGTTSDIQPIFFTSLCLPPFKWFNYNSTGISVMQATDVTKMGSNPTWTKYLQFVFDLANEDVPLFRRIYCHNFSDRQYYKDIPSSEIIESQLESYILININKPNKPFTKEEIYNILGKLGGNYNCYKEVKQAYLIVNKEHAELLNYDEENYEIRRIRDHISLYQQGKLETYIYTNKDVLLKGIPNDVFLVGIGTIDDPIFEFAFAANVSKNLKRVKLWLIEKDYPAIEKLDNGFSNELFTFKIVDKFVTETVLHKGN